MVTLVLVFAAAGGLLIGSFVNVVAHRVPQGRSVVSPPSACPGCGHPIRPRDNVPVVSWLLLRGRCRDCGTSISIRYPIVEAATGVLFGLTVVVIGITWVLPAHLWFVGVGVALTLTDLDHQRIPDRILLPGLAVTVVLLGVGAGLDGEPGRMVTALGGGAAFFGGMLALALAVPRGMGMGDVKLAALLGLMLGYHGWGVLLVGAFLAFLLGGLVSVGLIAVSRAGRKDRIPFGPFLIAGAMLGIAFGPRIVDWYLG